MKPPKVSWDGTQLEVARGKDFCKAACRIKNADPFTKDSAGADLGISERLFCRVYDGGRVSKRGVVCGNGQGN